MICCGGMGGDPLGGYGDTCEQFFAAADEGAHRCYVELTVAMVIFTNASVA